MSTLEELKSLKQKQSRVRTRRLFGQLAAYTIEGRTPSINEEHVEGSSTANVHEELRASEERSQLERPSVRR